MRKLLVLLALLIVLPLGAARDFADNTTGRRIEVANVIDPNVGAFSAHCWAYPTSFPNADSHMIIHQNNGSGAGRNWIDFNHDGAPVAIESAIGGSGTRGATDIVSRTNEWISAGVSLSGGGAGSTLRLWLDGVDDGSSVKDPEAADGTHIIGEHKLISTSRHFVGRIGECAWWNTELDAADFAMLAAGFSATFVKPASLVAYVRGIRGKEDLLGNATTETGTVGVADHSPIIYPTQPISGFAAAGAPPARDLMIISRAMKYAPLPLLAGGMGLAWVINRRNKLLRDGRN